MFGPNEIKKAITFKIPDGDIPLEPTEQSELSLNSTDRNVQFKPHDKTTINIIDDEGTYFHQEIFTRFKMRSNPVVQNQYLLAKYRSLSVVLRHDNRFPLPHSTRDYY